MYRISIYFLKDKKLSKISTLLYSINPASIFLSCVYTESSFALFSLMGFYFLFVKKNQILPPIFFSISTGIRSNGIILSGFFIFNFLKKTKYTIVIEFQFFFFLLTKFEKKKRMNLF